MDNMGKNAVDRFTGFKGMVTGFCVYLTGCNQYLIQPECKDDNTYVEGRWLDVDRIEVLEGKKTSLDVETPGPDIAAPVK